MPGADDRRPSCVKYATGYVVTKNQQLSRNYTIGHIRNVNMILRNSFKVGTRNVRGLLEIRKHKRKYTEGVLDTCRQMIIVYIIQEERQHRGIV